MDVPNFIHDILEHELRQLHIGLLEKVALKHGLIATELVAEFIPDRLTIVPNSKVKVCVKKKVASTRIVEDARQCMARVWNRGKGGRCTRTKHGSCDYCCQHAENRKHGRIDEPVVKDLFPKDSASLYK